MPALRAAGQGRIEAAFLQPQPNDIVPRFEYETHLSAMTGADPVWPESTRAISQLRVSLKVAPAGVLSALKSARTVHIDIVDYPGEWLLDLPLMEQSFSQWSEGAIALARGPARVEMAAKWLAMLDGADGTDALDEAQAQKLAAGFTDYLQACRAAGLSACAPGRFLMPGDLADSPALTFSPLKEGDAPRRSLGREMARRFEAYKSQVVYPFFRDHFSRIDRQVVLVDALGAIHSGPQAVGDLRDAFAEIMGCFKAGQNGWFSALRGKSVERVLFAATKADHLHQNQHQALTQIMGALVRSARSKAEYQGARTDAMAIASLRATTEETRKHEGESLDLVRGRSLETGKQVAMFAGALPDDPSVLLKPAEADQQGWLDGEYAVMGFAPAEVSIKAGDGPPHIRLDRAAEFLIGDRLG